MCKAVQHFRGRSLPFFIELDLTLCRHRAEGLQGRTEVEAVIGPLPATNPGLRVMSLPQSKELAATGLAVRDMSGQLHI